jgi:hypothetical protein
MNQIFREHVTSTAFALQLSKRQCWELLMIGDKQPYYNFNMTTLRALADRGLISWGKDADGRPAFNGLTRAGELVTELLREAGMTIENTMPARYREAA